MNFPIIFNHPLVSRLTFAVSLLTLTFLAGCSTLGITKQEECNSRAYLRTPLDTFIRERFPYGAPVRLGIIPFAAPANLSINNLQLPGAGNQIARQIQREFLSQGSVTITEILPRSNWPGQYDEFYHGNFRSLDMARVAGYDLVLVGVVEPVTELDSLTASSKLIEVASGITVWNGRSNATTNRTSREKFPPSSWWLDRDPSKLNTNLLYEKLAFCLVENALAEDHVPE